MSDRGIDRLHPSDEPSFGRDKDQRNRDQRTIDIVLTLGDERRIQHLDAMVVAMIEGACVFGGVVDDMTVDDGASRVCLVHVLSRQHRQGQGGDDCTDGHDDFEGPGFQHEHSV